jgi:hypothetical protein
MMGMMGQDNTLGGRLRQRITDHVSEKAEAEARAKSVELERRARQAIQDITDAANHAINQSPPPEYIELKDPINVLSNIPGIDELAKSRHLGRVALTSEMVSSQGLQIIQFCADQGLMLEIGKDSTKRNSFNAVYIWFCENS